YTGQTTVSAGILQDNAASALGALTGDVVVNSGATLQLNPGAGSTYLSKRAVLNGTGFGLTLSGVLLGTGALQNIANATSTWIGNIVLNTPDATVGSIQGTLALAGTVSGTGGLTKVGTGTVVLAATDAYSGNT